MGTGFPWSVCVTKIVFDQFIVLDSDIFEEVRMEIAGRGEAVEVVDCFGIELHWPAAAVNKERVFAGTMSVELSHDCGVCLGRLQTEYFPILVLDSVEQVVFDTIVLFVRVLEPLFFPKLPRDEGSIESIFNVGWGESFVSCHQERENLVLGGFLEEKLENQKGLVCRE